MRKPYRVITILFAAVLLFSSLSLILVSAATSGDYKYEVVDGGAVITEYVGNGSKITIPKSLGGYPVTGVGREIFVKTNYYNDTNSNWSGKEKDILYIGDVLVDVKYYSEGSLNIKEGTRIIADYAVYMSNSITDVTIPASVEHIGKNAFAMCGNINSISIDPANKNFVCEDGIVYNKNKTELVCCLNSKSAVKLTIPSTVTKIKEYAFYGCKDIYEISIPSSVKEIGEYAFAYCENLTSVKLPAAITQVSEGCFDHCSDLSSVVLSADTVSIGDYAFRWCSGFSSFNIPSKVSKIGNSTFYECRGMKNIIMPASIKSVDDGAFYDCLNLENLYFTGTRDQWGSVTIATNNNELKSAKINCNWKETGAKEVASVGGYISGDVDQDMTLNVKDATQIQKHLADITVLGSFKELLADYDDDSKLTLKDATAIQKYLAGIE